LKAGIGLGRLQSDFADLGLYLTQSGENPRLNHGGLTVFYVVNAGSLSPLTAMMRDFVVRPANNRIICDAGQSAHRSNITSVVPVARAAPRQSRHAEKRNRRRFWG
jgi:hypothetical protein